MMEVDRTCNREWKERRNGWKVRHFLLNNNFSADERARFMSPTGWVWSKISRALSRKFKLPRKACDAIFLEGE